MQSASIDRCYSKWYYAIPVIERCDQVTTAILWLLYFLLLATMHFAVSGEWKRSNIAMSSKTVSYSADDELYYTDWKIFALQFHHFYHRCGWTVKPRSPQCHLPTQLKDVSVSTIPGALSALEALCDYALYKSTFTFTFTLLLATYCQH